MRVHLAMAVLPAHVQWLILCQHHRDSASVPHATSAPIRVAADFFIMA